MWECLTSVSSFEKNPSNTTVLALPVCYAYLILGAMCNMLQGQQGTENKVCILCTLNKMRRI